MPAKGSGAGRRKGGPQLVIRLSEAERDELLRRAARAKVGLSAYVRGAALKGWTAPSVSPPTNDAV